MSKVRWLFNSLLALILTFSLLAAASGSALAKKDDPPKADPRLLQMAEENPDAIFMVIVQKEAKNKDLKDMELEDEVLKGGGQVTKQLDLIVSFSAELTGKELTKLARHPKVRWISADAPMVPTAGPGMETVRDEFVVQSYDGNDGSATWSGDWSEVGESGGTNPTKGSITAGKGTRCAAGYCLRLSPSLNNADVHIYRQVDLSGATYAELSLYRKNQLDSNANQIPGSIEEVQLQISADGGASWVTLRTYSSTEFTGVATDTFDISSYASSATQIRFIITSGEDGYRFLYVDDIQIAYARASAFLPTIKADLLNLDGQGVTVAVVDSGIAYHNDFKISGSNKSRIKGNEYFTGSGGSDDLFGHGTHVAGIIAGNGAMSNGVYKGVASGVDLINLKVSDKDGMTYESDVVESLQWIYNYKSTYNIRVVNISMNSTVAQSYHASPLSAAVEILWFNGIVVVVSAGNNGTSEGPVTIYPPANDPFVITVGATEDHGTSSLADDNLAVFSAYGTTTEGYLKPDLVAPGRNIIAPLSAKASTVYNAHPKHRAGDNYFRMSGTSMSAPVVSGAVALLLQDEPGLNPDQVKYRLMNTASQNWPGYNGTGYLDAYAAVTSSTDGYANQGILPSLMLATGSDAIDFASVGWNSVGWNSVGWNSVGWNSVGWNSVGWNSVGWNSVGWNSVGWNSGTWDD